jgi:predicted permease
MGNSQFAIRNSKLLLGIMETLTKDLRYAARGLLKHRAFTAVAIITLALGIGANTAIFTVVNAVLLRPLPYSKPEQLMMVGTSFPSMRLAAVTKNKFLFWQQHSQSFEAMTTFRTFSGATLVGGTEPEDITGLRVSQDFFRVIGVNPSFGRTFSPEEDTANGPRVVILTDGLWKRLFNGSTEVINQTVAINNVNYAVIGVMPEGFWFEVDVDVIVPLQLGTSQEVLAGGANYPVLGRLKPGLSREQALSEMKLVASQFRSSYPAQVADAEGVNVIEYRDFMVGDIHLSLLVLFLAVGFVLLIACANVANLQLSRTAARRKEIAIRSAVGASRWRVIRQLLVEGVLLSLAGGIAGILLAVWGVAIFKTLIPEDLIPRADQIGFDPRVLFFTLVVTALAGILFGLAPALQSTRLDVVQVLKEAAGKGTEGSSKARLRNVLVVSQIALALILLVGATLLIRTFANLRAVDAGFDWSHLLTFQVANRGPKYTSTAQISEFNRQAIEKIKALPGVEAVATTNTLPLNRWLNLPLEFEGGSEEAVSAEWRMISGNYFDTMKMSLKLGRGFTDSDSEGAAGVVIVNEAFARRYYQNSGPLGQRIVVARVMGPKLARPGSLEVIGVVSDTKQRSLMEKAPPTIYVPTAQVPDALMAELKGFTFVIRTSGDPLPYAAMVRREMLALDSQQPPRNVRSMEQVLASSIAPQRFYMLLLGLFGAVGLALAAIGIYGVMAYTVARRTQEIGIRMAMGAQIKDVLRMVMGRGMVLTLIGVAIGVVSALALTRAMKALLFGVTPTDIVTFTIVSVGLMVVAMLACYVPARRAGKIDPLEALRYE